MAQKPRGEREEQQLPLRLSSPLPVGLNGCLSRCQLQTLTVFLLLAVTGRLLQGFDDQGGRRGDHLDLQGEKRPL